MSGFRKLVPAFSDRRPGANRTFRIAPAARSRFGPPSERVFIPGWRFSLACLVVLKSAAVLSAEPALASPSLSVLPGPALFEQHRLVEAAAAFESEIRQNPKLAAPLIYLGRIAFEENRINDAAQFFERATVVESTNSAAYHWLGRALGIQARALGPPRGIGPARKTKKALEQAVNLNPDNLEARFDLATFYREAPMIVGGSTRLAQAQVQEINARDSFRGALIQGDFAMEAKQFADAERFYGTARAIQTNHVEPLIRLGLLSQKLQRYDQAFELFEQALRLNANEVQVLYQIGKTADLSGHRLERGEEALKLYLKCSPFYLMPKLGSARRRLASIYSKQGRVDLAREELASALAKDPDDKDAAAALKKLKNRTAP